MRSPEAITAALALLQNPHLVRPAARSALPKGMTWLLECAAGEMEALALATAITGHSENTLKDAAGFFIEQLLLNQGACSYRVLGGDRKTPEPTLRRHMALLMRWLHPDVTSGGSSHQNFSKSSFAHRVTRAWETVKTAERRAAYNDAGPTTRPEKSALGPAFVNYRFPLARPNSLHRQPQRVHLWERLLLRLGGWY
jgi:hypothetical protein